MNNAIFISSSGDWYIKDTKRKLDGPISHIILVFPNPNWLMLGIGIHTSIRFISSTEFAIEDSILHWYNLTGKLLKKFTNAASELSKGTSETLNFNTERYQFDLRINNEDWKELYDGIVQLA